MRLKINRVRGLVAAGAVLVAVAVPSLASAQEGVFVSSASGKEVLATTLPPTTTLPPITLPPEVRGEVITTKLPPVTLPTEVRGEVITTTVVAPASIKPDVLGETVSNSGLAVTGADIAGLGAIGVVLLGGGAAMIAARRRSIRNS